ncbi:unnamed protein product [Clavelina lepadiformis]|uniref:Methyltransferase type 11 domain-containing protein n=1 Tax=Clavelina lepadiformis TaxID=159417 RepID=A0ABP0F899_CLALP
MLSPGEEKRISNMVGKLSPCVESNRKIYNQYAEGYDAMNVAVGNQLPSFVAKLCLKHLPANVKNNMEQCTVLDFPSCTGYTAKSLRDKGFTGIIDGVDGSVEMIKVAEKKNLYRKITTHLITPDNPIPFGDNCYDVVINGANHTFTPGNVEPESVCEFLRVLRPGGIMLLNAAHLAFTDVESNSKQDLQDVIERLQDEGKCELIEEVDVDIFQSRSKFNEFQRTTVYCISKAVK